MEFGHDFTQWVGLATLAATIWWIVRRRHDDAITKAKQQQQFDDRLKSLEARMEGEKDFILLQSKLDNLLRDTQVIREKLSLTKEQ